MPIVRVRTWVDAAINDSPAWKSIGAPGQGERVHALRVQRGVDGRQPAALAVADEVGAAAGVDDRPVDDVEVVGDRDVAGRRVAARHSIA